MPRTSQQSTRNMLERVANAASSPTTSRSEGFPVLTAPLNKSKLKTGSRLGNPTPWSSSSANRQPPPTSSATVQSFSVPGPATTSKAKSDAPKFSNSLFPSLPPPSSTTALEARQLVNGDRNKKPSNTAWGSSHESIPVTPAESENENNEALVNPRGKKKKGKEKQTLFTLGTFPT
jgi:E3 ubiquitin-protein ligase ZNF598